MTASKFWLSNVLRPTLFGADDVYSLSNAFDDVPWVGVPGAVALNPFVHGAESAAEDGLAATVQVISKSDARAPIVPVIIYQTLRNPVLATDADAILVELNAGKNRIGAGA